jgi:N-hydroxyarylamine O-acetyltransferase
MASCVLLLEDLGFTVTRLAARVLCGTTAVLPRSHQVLLATIGSDRWIVDVGFGGNGLLAPFPLTVGHTERQEADYFRLMSTAQGEYLLQAEVVGQWEDLYAFTLEPYLPVDYVLGNWYCSTSPDSKFAKQQIATLPTKTGRKTMTDRHLSIRDGGTKRKLHAHTPEEVATLLATHFGLHLADAVTRLVRSEGLSKRE